MAIEIKLVGFGEDRPARFDARNRLRLEVEAPPTVREMLRCAGIDEAPDLIVMDSDSVIPATHWGVQRIEDETSLTIFCAIEGG